MLIDGWTWSNKVPPTKKPFSKPSTLWPRPSTTSVAPCSTPSPIKRSMRWRAACVTTGPISMPALMPSPIFNDDVRSASAATSLSPASPIATATEIAMQRSPAEP